MTYILGISAFYHDSAACILIDGEIIAAAQEERFTRKKHDPSYPYNAIEFVLKYANLKLHEVDQIVFFEKNSSPMWHLRKLCMIVCFRCSAKLFIT